MQQDKETKKILAEGERIANFVKSDDWKHIKSKLFEQMGKVNSLVHIPESFQGQDLILEAGMRRGAISLIMDWINDIEGTAEQNETNQDLFAVARKDAIIKHVR